MFLLPLIIYTYGTYELSCFPCKIKHHIMLHSMQLISKTNAAATANN